MTRWLQDGDNPDHLAKFSVALLTSLRGSLCIYQGEELALQEADVAFEDPTDPYGIRFWPAYKGRDGCRTPMVWENNTANAGFTSGKPWLPVSEAHKSASVDTQGEDSVLAAYRQMLKFRAAHTAMQTGDITFLHTAGEVMAFKREDENETLLFVFNLDRIPTPWTLPEGLSVTTNLIPGFTASAEGNVINLNGLDAFCARLN